MKRETAVAVRSRINLGEAQEARLALMIRFPPPGCHSVEVWSKVLTDALRTLRGRLGEDRRELARLTRQSELEL